MTRRRSRHFLQLGALSIAIATGLHHPRLSRDRIDPGFDQPAKVSVSFDSIFEDLQHVLRPTVFAFVPCGDQSLHRQPTSGVVAEVIAEVAAQGPRDMGKVMGPALQRLGPATDGRQPSALVRRLLASVAGSSDE